MGRPEDQDRRFDVDVLLAPRVVAPALLAHRRRLQYWCFHRRAGRDGAGHQVSFLFYADAATAQTVLGELRSSPDLPALQASGGLIEELSSDASRLTRPGLGNMSDPAWPEELQRPWPYFDLGTF